MKPIHLILIFTSFLIVTCTTNESDSHIQKFTTHYNKLTTKITDSYGSQVTPMWLSMWNLETEEYPFDFSRPDSIPCRVYLDRSIDAPGGSTLYWDLPDIAAAVEISNRTGNKKLKDAAKAYVKSFLEKNTSKNGIILWGNHYYYDVFKDTAIRFGSSEPPVPVDFNSETGDLHEMRPILPPWELLYSWFPERIEKHIREAAKLHMANPETGEFNRHANQKSEYAFIESGSILVNSLAFLYSKTGDQTLLDRAETVLNYSFNNRHPETGLVINSPARKRWDQYTSTTEIGLWGLNILKATRYIPENKSREWIKIVETALQPWLINGFDTDKEMFYGSLNVTNAKPIPRTDDYPYKPETYADIWNPLFPTHNYPLSFAECCIELHKCTGKDLYKESSERWFQHVSTQLNNRNNYTLYAENYARVIHFLLHFGEYFKNDEATMLATQLGNETTRELFVDEKEMFRSHTNEMRYDAVDGIGLLFFPLSWIESGEQSKLAQNFF